MSQKIRWGIIGTGAIARQFAKGLEFLDDAELAAVGSRTQKSADAFGERFKIANRHDSYEGLAADPTVDVVYVATPNSLHLQNTLLCLNSGKHVLCEKPFTINADEAAQIIDLARKKKFFVMEAMWTRFFPVMTKLRELLAEGVIGEPRMLSADFGFRTDFVPNEQPFDAQLGGGALLDVGVYTVSLSSMIFGAPETMTSMAQMGKSNVDEATAMLLKFTHGELAVLHSAIRLETPQEAIIMGSEGQLKIHAPWWSPSKMALTFEGKPPQEFNLPFDGNGYNYQAQEVMRNIRTGRLESAIMPLDESLSIMQTLDKIRTQIGLKYPVE